MLPVMSLMTAKEGELILCHVFNIWNSFKKERQNLGQDHCRQAALQPYRTAPVIIIYRPIDGLLEFIQPLCFGWCVMISKDVVL